ncbi:MAG: C39 family peptidase [Fastidiosipilaceae bacterium]
MRHRANTFFHSFADRLTPMTFTLLCLIISFLFNSWRPIEVSAAGTEDNRIWNNGVAVQDEVMLELLHFRQADARWASVGMGVSQKSIGEYGCALTSLAMYATNIGVDTDPERLNLMLGDDANPVEWEAFAAELGYRLTHKEDSIDLHNKLVSKEYVEDTVVRSLSEGKPAIIGIWNSESYWTHFIVAYGYRYEDGNYVIYVRDPSVNNDYQTLDEIDPVWAYYRLVVLGE